MSDMRDYYLQNLGIGEIWKCRSTEDRAIDNDSAELSSKLSTSIVVGMAQKSDGTLIVDSSREQVASNLRTLERQVQNCSKCALCVSFGRAEFMQMTEPSDASIEVLVVTEFAAPLHIDAQEKLIENILLCLSRNLQLHQKVILIPLQLTHVCLICSKKSICGARVRC
jgi:hypothetical protein